MSDKVRFLILELKIVGAYEYEPDVLVKLNDDIRELPKKEFDLLNEGFRHLYYGQYALVVLPDRIEQEDIIGKCIQRGKELEEIRLKQQEKNQAAVTKRQKTIAAKKAEKEKKLLEELKKKYDQ